MANDDGSGPLPGDPVIMSFAFSMEEWAILSAELMFVGMQADATAAERGTPVPDDIQRMMDVGARFSRMVKDQIERLP